MATIGKKRAWRFRSQALTGPNPTYDFLVDVPNTHTWTRNVQSRIAQDPNGGPPTAIERADSPIPLRHITIPFRVPGAQNADTLLAQLRTAIWSGGAFYLTNPREALWGQFDPTSWTEEDQGTAWLVTVAFNEIVDPTIPVPPPPPPTAIILQDARLYTSDLMIRPHRPAAGAAPEYASQDVPVQWQGLVAPTVDDYVGIFPSGTVGSTKGDSVGWITTSGTASGITAIPQTGDLSGNYELRLVYGVALNVVHGPTLQAAQTGFYRYTNARQGTGYANVPLGAAVGVGWWHYVEDFEMDPVDGIGLTADETWGAAVWTQVITTPDDLSNNSFFVADALGIYKAILHRASGATVVAMTGLTVYSSLQPPR